MRQPPGPAGAPRDRSDPEGRAPRREPIDRLGWALVVIIAFVLGVTLLLWLVVLGLV